MAKTGKKILKKLEKKIVKDLQTLKEHWHRFLLLKTMLNKKIVLKKIATDIKKLNKDAQVAKKIKHAQTTGDLIYHLLHTPWSAPFSGDKSLLEAAISFDYQSPHSSDLYYLLEQFSHYSSHLENEFLMIYGSLYNKIEKKD